MIEGLNHMRLRRRVKWIGVKRSRTILTKTKKICFQVLSKKLKRIGGNLNILNVVIGL